MAKAIDVSRIDLYEYDKPKNRTTRRLTELSELGLEEVGIAEFGIPGMLSGLYIERVWHYTDEQWKGEINWINDVKKRKQ
jgi:hypothetical protein